MSGNQLRAVRKRYGLTQLEMAMAIGVSRATIRNWELGGEPSTEHLPTIEALLADRLVPVVVMDRPGLVTHEQILAAIRAVVGEAYFTRWASNKDRGYGYFAPKDHWTLVESENFEERVAPGELVRAALARIIAPERLRVGNVGAATPVPPPPDAEPPRVDALTEIAERLGRIESRLDLLDAPLPLDETRAMPALGLLIERVGHDTRPLKGGRVQVYVGLTEQQAERLERLCSQHNASKAVVIRALVERGLHGLQGLDGQDDPNAEVAPESA